MTDQTAARPAVAATTPDGIAARLIALPRGVVIAAVCIPEMFVVTFAALAITLLGIGVGIFVVPVAAAATAAVANGARSRAHRWSGVRIDSPYRPALQQAPGVAGWWNRTRGVLTERARWRDLLWCVLDSVVGPTLGLIPIGALAYGLFGMIMPAVYRPILDNGGNNWYTFVHVESATTAWFCFPVGVVVLVLGILYGRAVLTLHARWCRWLLAPSATSTLAARVSELRESRTEAVDSRAAEIRRIERDLHDGAQAKLVAMGMKLNVVETLLDSDPATARALVGETKADSVQALTELRSLVRGIHPPVLADRGLADALRSLGYDLGLAVTITGDPLPRLDPPIESAAYFAVTELMTNIGKHAHTQAVVIGTAHTDRQLGVTVHDEGVGGAHVADGGGLAGIRRRLSAFDGTLDVTSPVGGPTDVRIVIPCG